MAYQSLDLGTSADDGTGDSLRVGGDKINDNFSEIYTLLGTGTALTSGLSATASVVTLSSAVGTFTTLTPATTDGTALGSASLVFSDLYLADSSIIYFGENQDVTLTHVADVGLKLKSVATADDKPIILTLQTGETDIAASDVLGKIEFQAPDEGTGTDAILVAAHIAAISEGDFSSSNNATKLSFATGASEAASEKMSLSSAGLLTIADDLVIKTGGTIGGANDTDLLTLTSAVLTVAGEVVGTGFTGTLDGILGSGAAAAATTTTLDCTTITASGTYTGGGLMTTGGNIIIPNGGNIGSVGDTDAIAISSAGVVTFSATPVFGGDSTFSDDVSFTSDAAVLSFGENSEITLTHVHNVGLTLTHTGTGDNLPVVLQLKSEEDAIIVNEVIASLEFAAGDSDGTDGATVAAGIHAIAEDTFSATANATKLVFTTGVSETAAASATAKATLSSIGDFQVAGDLVVKNGGLIGSASDLDAIAIASNGVVTFSQIPVMPADSIDSDEYIDGSIDREHLAADIIDGTKIADDAIDSEHYTNGSIDTAHIAADQIVASLIADDAIDSEHYTDGSIDTAHIADNQVTLAKMAGGTDGNIISYDASGDPVAIATGNDGQVLTSTGAGSPPAFEDVADTGFPSGTIMIFQQTAAPTGWTKDTTAAINDGALRTTTGTVGTGGTVAFETAFASKTPAGSVSVGAHSHSVTVGATTISTSTMPAHTHTTSFNAQNGFGGNPPRVSGNTSTHPTNSGLTQTSNSTGGGGSHTHSGSSGNATPSGSFSGTAIDLNVKFYDVIIAAKD